MRAWPGSPMPGRPTAAFLVKLEEGLASIGNLLHDLPNAWLQTLLDQTVEQLAATCPPGHVFGDEISLDTKLILAWVKENNPKEFVPDRFNKHRQPQGDPDCKLGCKERTNQRRPTPHSETAPGRPIGRGRVLLGLWLGHRRHTGPRRGRHRPGRNHPTLQCR
ncbi:MAG: hypothetical protein IPK16_33235 [Anaerolineales bacterium]|nr:hypothetical protein [Anaerolineales bacterium]